MTTYAGQYGPLVPTLPGDPLEVTPGDSVAVRHASNGQLATLYTTRARLFVTANPTTIDEDGNLVAFAEPGQYTIHRVTLGVEGEGQLVSFPIDPLEQRATSITELFVNANENGAVAGQESSIAIQTSINEAAAGGGGTVMLGFGEYFASELVLPSGVALRGAGYGGTTLTLSDGANTFLIESLGFSGLTGHATAGGIRQSQITDISLDGNKSGQTSGSEALIRLYGYDFKIDAVRIRNALNTGLWAEWGTDASDPGPDSMEASLSDVKVHNCGGDGITWRGPHDSMWDKVITYSNAGIGMNILPDGGALVMDRCHSWGLEQTYAMWFGANVLAYNCHAEGAKICNVVFAANDCQYYGSVDAATGLALKGIQIGTPGTGEGHEVAGSIIRAFIGNCTNGAVSYVNDFGSRVEITVFTTVPTVAAVGTKAAATLQLITGNATDAGMSWPVGFFYGQQMVLQTTDGSSLSVRTSSLSNKRTRQDFTAQGVDQWAWITDKDVLNAHDIILFDPINGRQLFIGRDDGTMELPRFYKRETVVASTPYTVLISDVGSVLGTFNAGANVVTIPANATAAFPIGTFLEVCQLGAGQTTLTPAGGVTLRSPNGLKTRAQWSTARLYKRDTNEWVVSGDVTT